MVREQISKTQLQVWCSPSTAHLGKAWSRRDHRPPLRMAHFPTILVYIRSPGEITQKNEDWVKPEGRTSKKESSW